MSNALFPYSEDILQWIWKEGLVDFSALQTTCGKSIQVINPGTLNTSDGPDFTFATISIDGLTWSGSIEMHLKSSDWYHHNHQFDGNYDNVILHVVVQNNPKAVKTRAGNQPFTVNLLSALPTELCTFIKNLEYSNNLPCAQNVQFISNEIFSQQIDQAHNEYLEKKTEDFLTFYDPAKLQSKAWIHALIISVFDGFGISNNRLAMQQLAQLLLEKISQGKSIDQSDVHDLAFGARTNISWNYKGCRPNNHPQKRIETAFIFCEQILQTPFSTYLTPEALTLWKQWCAHASISFSGHAKILYGTVFLPALFLLSNLYVSEKLKVTILKEWRHFKAPIPPNLLKKFTQLEVSPSVYKNKLGAIHQLNNYCRPKRCANCIVLKKAILS